MGYVYLFRSIAQLSIVFVLCSFLTFVLCDHFTWLMTPSLGNCTCGKRSQCAPLRVSPPQQGSTAAKLEKLTRVNMSLTLSCKLVEVFAMIYAVLLQNQAQDSVVLCHQILHFQSPPSNLLAVAAVRSMADYDLPLPVRGSFFSRHICHIRSMEFW